MFQVWRKEDDCKPGTILQGEKEDRQQLLSRWSFSVLPEKTILKKEKEIPLALPNQC